MPRVSIHALLAECDHVFPVSYIYIVSFNPRTPCGVRRAVIAFSSSSCRFQSTHSLRSATQILKGGGNVPGVSIHALLAECDYVQPDGPPRALSFNPRTPCGVRLCATGRPASCSKFQSTHSLRSATGHHLLKRGLVPVSIHALLAECDLLHPPLLLNPGGFNPRTPCGVRHTPPARPSTLLMFQSTHSLRSATRRRNSHMGSLRVSIHALLAECDLMLTVTNEVCKGFNPRTPCGVRRTTKHQNKGNIMFQSTHSLRSATCNHATGTKPCEVSIHALLAECDVSMVAMCVLLACFNPRTPCGVRRDSPRRMILVYQFQSTHSLRSATQPTLYITTQQSKSYFAPTSLKRPSLHGYTF